MKCQHRMCDLCGGRDCTENRGMRRFGNIIACDSCQKRAVEHAYNAACTWGGTEIDHDKPCGLVEAREAARAAHRSEG